TPVLVTPEQVAAQVSRVTRLATFPPRPHRPPTLPPRPRLPRRLPPDGDIETGPDPEPEPFPEPEVEEPPAATMRYLEAARARAAYLRPPVLKSPAAGPELQLQAVKLELLSQLQPETTLPRRAFARLSGDTVQPSAEAEPGDLAQGLPSYAEPMYTGLR